MKRSISIILLGLALSSSAEAGLSPHNVAVIVNEDSWTSKAVANEYIRLRNIPPANVIYLNDIPDTWAIDVEEFRQRILKPIVLTISERGIANQIECITYSADFPWQIGLKSDIDKTPGQKPPHYLTPYGSLTGMTYLVEYVFREDINYLQLSSNAYFRKRVQAGGPFLPNDSEKIQYREAIKMMDESQWKDAQKVLERLLDTHDHVGVLWYHYARCLTENEKYLDGLKALEKAVANGYLQADQAENEESLRPLRSTEGFRDLLNKMRNPEFETEDAYAFSHQTSYDVPFTKKPVHYMMSTMLGVTVGRGNSVSEILECLRNSAKADDTLPAASFYFSKTKDIRSTTRDGWFDAAVAKLRESGRHALIIKDDVPKFRRDIGGLMNGTPAFDWSQSQSKIIPGAICEHLTSFGGMMNDDATQTPISEWIRYGASGTSGTVYEPFALQPKFPTAFLHVYYSRGYSLAESFYLSVQSPYQLLILGDPLCQPWATEPRFELEFKPGQEIGTSVPLLTQPKDNIDRFAVLVDGVEQSSSIPGVRDFLRINGLSDGVHELTVVATAKAQPQTDGRKTVPFTIKRYGKSVELSLQANENDACCSLGEKVTLKAQCADAEKINVYQSSRLLGSIEGSEGELEVVADIIGLGDVQLFAVGEGDGWSVRSSPLSVKIAPPPLRKAMGPARGLPLKPGVLLTTKTGKVELQNTRNTDWMQANGLKMDDTFELSGYHDATQEDLYQLEVSSGFELEVTLNGVPVELPPSDQVFRCVPLSLDKGRHHITVKGTMIHNGDLKVHFGNQGRPVMGDQLFQIRR